MRLLTPTGYRDIEDCQIGDEVSAFDLETGTPVVNLIDTKDWVDYTEWVRWHTGTDLPPFQFYRINNIWTLNSEQSIWRNGTQVCHAKDLIVGDTLYDDTDQPFQIVSIEEVEADGWWRFEISGDHSYIVDGLTLHNASRFWVGGTGTWDAVTTTHWAASTGGAGGQTVPGSADSVTLDGASGGGTVTVNFGGTISITTLVLGAFTGTLDFATNNNSVSLSTLSYTGSAVRTFNMGSGTWTFAGSGAATTINGLTTTSLTLSSSSANLVFTATTSSLRGITTGGTPTFASLTVSANTSGGSFTLTTGGGSLTITSLTIVAPNYISFPSGVTTTLTNAPSIAGSSSNQIGLASVTINSPATISSGNNMALSWCSLRDLTGAGAGTHAATSSFNLGDTSGITITAPAASTTISVDIMSANIYGSRQMIGY